MAKTKGTNGAAATTTTTTTTNGGRTHTTPSAKASYVQMSKLFATGAHAMDATDRVKVLTALSKPVSEAAPGELGSVEPMAVWEEVLAALFLLIFVGSMLWIPLALLLFVIYVRDPVAWAVLVVAWLGLTLHPLKRYHDLVHSPLNRLLFKYFSLRMASDVQIDPEGQYIFVAPPHGVLPMGNLLTVHAMRNINGLDFRGLTTSAALTLPLFRHYLGSIGTIAASSHIASDYLDQGWSLGISSGGVAEIFETNNPHEVVLMKERKGFVKLALRKGVAIVPCFIFGNTKLLSAWYDEGGVLQNLSRKLKFGMLPIWGRFGLPLLYRQPVLGVMAAPIMCPKVEGEPSQEMIDKYHTEFCDALVKLFDCYKGAYGWPDKQLLLK